MPTIQEVRQKYPQYNDLTDNQLAGALHKKFYSDVPIGQFYASIGLGQAPNAAAKADRELQSASFGDVARSAESGVRSGIGTLIGTPGDMRDAIIRGGDWAGRKLGILDDTPEHRATVEAHLGAAGKVLSPSSAQANDRIQELTGKYHEPQSTAGKYARTIGEFAPAALMGPGGVARRAAMAIIPGAMSEAAGQGTEGKAAEPFARAGAALAGGVGTAMAGAKRAIPQMAKAAPSGQAVKAATDQMYDTLRKAGITYDANSYGKFVVDLARKFKADGFREAQAPKAADVLKYLGEHIGKSPDFADLDSIRKSAGELARSIDPTERRFAAIIVDQLDDWQRAAPLATNGSIPANQVAPLMKQAREMASRNIKNRQVEDMIEAAKTYQSGYESGLRNQASNFLRSKKVRGWTTAELKALQTVAKGTPLSNVLGSIGRGGLDPTNTGNRSLLGPSVTGAAGALMGGGSNPMTAALAIAGATGAKFASKAMTQKAANNLSGVIRAGKAAQGKFTKLGKAEQLRMLVRQMLAAENASIPLRQEPVPQFQGRNR